MDLRHIDSLNQILVNIYINIIGLILTIPLITGIILIIQIFLYKKILLIIHKIRLTLVIKPKTKLIRLIQQIPQIPQIPQIQQRK